MTYNKMENIVKSICWPSVYLQSHKVRCTYPKNKTGKKFERADLRDFMTLLIVTEKTLKIIIKIINNI